MKTTLLRACAVCASHQAIYRKAGFAKTAEAIIWVTYMNAPNAEARNFKSQYIQIGFAQNAAEETVIQTVLVQFATRLTQINANIKHSDSQAVMNGSVQRAEKLTLTMSAPAVADKLNRKM